MPNRRRIGLKGPILDRSGYGEATRGLYKALRLIADVEVDPIGFQPWATVGAPVPNDMVMASPDKHYDKWLVNLPPHKLADKGPLKKTVVHLAWESTLIPKRHVELINKVASVWVPCHWVRQSCWKSGVTRPIGIVPHVVEIDDSFCPVEGLVSKDTFVFASISQFSRRKGFDILLKAYLQEFRGYENVELLIKTFPVSGKDREMIEKFRQIKASVPNSDPPKIKLITQFLSEEEIETVYATAGCYISTSRAEGFGFGPFRAAARGTPVIVPDYSSFPDFFSANNAYMIEVPEEVPIEGMGVIQPLYTCGSDAGRWGEPSIESVREKMREVYTHQASAAIKGRRAASYIRSHLSAEAVSKKMII